MTWWSTVALIRPGPIQGGSGHPCFERRNGAAWSHAHPLLERSLGRTLGVSLFQETGDVDGDRRRGFCWS